MAETCRQGNEYYAEKFPDQKDNGSKDPWTHRSSRMLCRSCMWFVEKKVDGPTVQINTVGRCRRHAPAMSGYPVVFMSDWCGDHKLDEAKA